ncbi:MAG: type IX secretion system membrane protein PorP/SprF [Bacteroidia bacterium]
MKKSWYIIFAICFCLQSKAQHNSDYIQYMFNGLLLNPAYAGSREALDITGLYRNQWMGIVGSPVTSSFGAHTPLKNKHFNIGMTVVNDKFGLFNQTTANLIYAYRMRFLKGNLSFGVQGGVNYITSNWSKINTIQKDDPNFSSTSNDAKITPEAGFGTYYYSKNFYVGLSAPNVFNETLSKYRTVIGNTGILVNISEDFKIKPAILVKYIYSSPLSTNLSSTFYWKDFIGLGLGYTLNTSAMAFIDLKLNEQLRFGYGYDYALNRLNIYTSGSHEIMLRYLFKYKINPLSVRYF